MEKVLEVVGISFLNIKFVVGDNNQVCFWHELWCGNSLLRYQFLDLILQDMDKGTYVASYLGCSKEIVRNWNPLSFFFFFCQIPVLGAGISCWIFHL